jgi:Serine dehydrogenase proteinase
MAKDQQEKEKPVEQPAPEATEEKSKEEEKKERVKKTPKTPIESPFLSEIKRFVKPLYEERGIDQILLFDGISGDSYLKLAKIVKSVENSKEKEIDVIVHSSGGLAEYAYRSIKLLRTNFKTVNIIVPFWAKSAASLLSFGGSKIIVDDNAEFGPLDAQIWEENKDEVMMERDSVLTDEASLVNLEERSCHLFMDTYAHIYSGFYETPFKLNKKELSDEVLKFVANFYQPLLSQIDPYKMGKKRRITNVAIEYIEKILSQYNPIDEPLKKNKFIKYIIYECPDHGFIVDFDTLSQYLQNIYKSDTVSTQYSANLRLLSEFLITIRVNIEEKVKDANPLEGIVIYINDKTYV